VAERLASDVLSLPMYPDLPAASQQRVVEAVLKATVAKESAA
jgi:dTDP-4-amino-4,6-dideoxygalactose transaminase